MCIKEVRVVGQSPIVTLNAPARSRSNSHVDYIGRFGIRTGIIHAHTSFSASTEVVAQVDPVSMERVSAAGMAHVNDHQVHIARPAGDPPGGGNM